MNVLTMSRVLESVPKTQPVDIIVVANAASFKP